MNIHNILTDQSSSLNIESYKNSNNSSLNIHNILTDQSSSLNIESYKNSNNSSLDTDNILTDQSSSLNIESYKNSNNSSLDTDSIMQSSITDNSSKSSNDTFNIDISRSSNINHKNHSEFNNLFKTKTNRLKNKIENIQDIRNNALSTKNLGEFYTYYRRAPTDEAGEHIHNFLSKKKNSFLNKTWAHEATLVIEYVFLDVDERRIFSQLEHEYLVEQVTETEHLDLLPQSQICLELYHPVKEFLFTFSRNDNYLRNEWLNHTSFPYNMADEVDYQYYLQDNWWNHCNEIASNNTNKIIINNEEIVCDKFQEFILRFGPYGEAGDPTGKLLGFKIQNNYSLYSLEEIDRFKTIWQFTQANNIPNINMENWKHYKQNPFKNMLIRFNGQIREDRKNAEYYSQIQPFLHHTGHQEELITVYSFSLEPEKYQPSGSCNFSQLNNITFDIELEDTPKDNKNPRLGKNISREYEYDARFFIINYNILRISSGMAGIVFGN